MSGRPTFALDDDQLDLLSPFVVVCGDDLTIQRIGPSLRKALGRDLAGSGLLEAFAIERPHGVTTPEDVRANDGEPFLLRSRDRKLSLRCQSVTPHGGRVVFVGSVALASESEISELGLGYADFAAADPTPDLLILKRSLERSLHDLGVLNADLESSTAQLRSANAALADAERRYRALVEQQPLVTYIDEIGDQVTSLFASENVVDVTGYSAERWTTEPGLFFSIVHPDDVERVREAHLLSTAEGSTFASDFRFVRPDGESVWVHAEDRPVLDEAGTPLYRLGYLLDITERRRAEDELRDTGTRLRTLIESLQAGILVEDEHRRVALTNEVFCGIFGLPVAPADLIGSDCRESAELTKHLAADPEQFVARIDATLEGRAAVYAEEVEFADGRVFERDYVPVVIEGEYRGHLWGYRDVTPRIEAQREVELAHDEAVAASRAKSEFLATVSHEIRTPMHGVLGTADLLQRTSLDGEQRDLVEMLKRSATALLTVINDMLDLQKAEGGYMELACVPVDAGALVGEVAAALSTSAGEKGLELAVSVDGAIPLDLLGDPGRIRQILLNLVANAVKFTSTGSVAVSVLLEELDDRSAALGFVVADTGVGIPAEAQERVFEPFAQADASSTRHHEGTGLGLAITRQLVELMSGSITLESTPGLGTTVTAVVRLLRGPGLSPEATQPSGAPRALSGRVLVAEDSPVNRELVLRQLRRLGVSATAVDSGTAALETLANGHYDLVLMDLRMPGMDGLAATRAIRARERERGGRPRTVIVAMTANVMAENREACFDAGMDDFAGKPLVLDDLALVLERWLPGNATAAEPDPQAADISTTLDNLAEDLASSTSAHRIAELWLGELPARLDDLRAAAAAGEVEAVRDCAHTLKSTCALVGAAEATALAAEIEHQAAAGVPPGPAIMADLEHAVESAVLHVLAWHATQDPEAG